jgi:hypothetical protein
MREMLLTKSIDLQAKYEWNKRKQEHKGSIKTDSKTLFALGEGE